MSDSIPADVSGRAKNSGLAPTTPSRPLDRQSRVRPAPLLALLFLLPVAAAQDPSAARDPRNFTWIEKDVLALGGGGLTEADVDWLYDAGFRAIVDLRAEHSDPQAYIRAKGMAFLDMPIDSASHINETQLATFISWAAVQEAAKRPIYIHCTNGWHRAATFAVAWGLAREQETTDHEAREVTQARPGGPRSSRRPWSCRRPSCQPP